MDCGAWALKLCWLVCEAACLFWVATGARVAVIGDFGRNTAAEAQVAQMINDWDATSTLDAVLTTGDNNYDTGSSLDIDQNVGKHYSRYMYEYKILYGSAGLANAPATGPNRFWPLPGNHDWGNVCGTSGSLVPYLAYMPVGGKSYYDVVIGDMHFFMLDSDCNEPDGTSKTSVQANWTKARLENSTSTFKVAHLAAHSQTASHTASSAKTAPTVHSCWRPLTAP